MNTSSQINVIPTPYEDPKLITMFTYTVCDFKLSEYITFNVILLDANSIPIIVKRVTMAGADYAGWGNDDQYVINYICSSLNLVQQSSAAETISEPTPEPTSEPTPEPTSEPTV